MIHTGQWIRATIELPPPYEEVLGCIGDESGFAYMLGWYDPHTFHKPFFENGEGPGSDIEHLLYWMHIPTPQGLKKKNLESQAPEWKAQEREEEHPSHIQYVKEKTFGTTPNSEVVKLGIVKIDESDLVINRYRLCYRVRKPESEQEEQPLTYLLEIADRPITQEDIQFLHDALSKGWGEYYQSGYLVEPNRIEYLGRWKNGRLLPKEDGQR